MSSASAQRLWHGGAPGRQIGELLEPPAVTGLQYTRLHQSIEEGQREIAQRLDRVYVTADRHLALACASTWTPDGVRYRGGSLYLVESDVLEPDEDLLSLPGVSFQTRSARVIGVAKARVPFDRERSSRKSNEVIARLERAKRAATGT
jgi:hypothetical protein